MTTAKFTTIAFPISNLIGQIESGMIGLPELQRPFVWDRAQVRDLLDSLYRGYPAGHFLFWQTTQDSVSIPIGVDGKQMSPSFVVVDGQQRLTSLYAVFTGELVLTKDFEASKIRIAFNPARERFEVANATTANDSEWIDDVSQLLASTNQFAFITEFMKRATDAGTGEETLALLPDRLTRLAGLSGYVFNAIQLSSDLPVDEVSEIFVRVNSKGTPLSQADFILTLMSVHWDAGRKKLEDFCREARIPTKGKGPFNWYIEPSPDQLLRVAIGLGHRRAQLRYAYELLRGKDLATKEVSVENRIENFAKLKDAQGEVLDLTNWTEYLKALQEAGYKSGRMITSKTAIVYCYLVYLIGRRDFAVDVKTLRSAVARWFFMVMLTSRYTGSPESQVEKDIRRFAEATSAAEFLAIIDSVIASQLTNDYWEVTLPEQLAWSGGFVPAWFAYVASLNLLGACALFSTLTVQDLVDPVMQGKKAKVERHHLFPKAFLEKSGVKARTMINQQANYALLEWPDNIKVSDSPPTDYFPKMFTQHEQAGDGEKYRFWHALPSGWEDMEYEKFLVERRRLMARVVRAGFEKLATGFDPLAKAPVTPPLALGELIADGESLTVEFKSSLCHSYKPDVPERTINHSVLKTIAAFLNTEGGTLGIGVTDEGDVVGIEADLTMKKFDLDRWENYLTTMLKEKLQPLAVHLCRTRFEVVDGRTACLVDVQAASAPVYARSEQGKDFVFYVRAGNTTRELNTQETVQYVADRWGLTA